MHLKKNELINEKSTLMALRKQLEDLQAAKLASAAQPVAKKLDEAREEGKKEAEAEFADKLADAEAHQKESDDKIRKLQALLLQSSKIKKTWWGDEGGDGDGGSAQQRSMSMWQGVAEGARGGGRFAKLKKRGMSVAVNKALLQMHAQRKCMSSNDVLEEMK